MRRGSLGPLAGLRVTRRSRSSFRLLGDRGQLEHVELRRALWPRDHEAPFERADPLKYPGHVTLRVVAVGHRGLLVAERERAEEYQAGRVVIFPQPPGRTLASGLLHDRQQIFVDLNVAEEWLEALVRLALGGRLAELDQPAIVAPGCRSRP